MGVKPIMQQYEQDYGRLIDRILNNGVVKKTRNGNTISVFGESIKVDLSQGYFPLIQGREMKPKGILGEFAAMIRGPKCLEDFEKWGCNYWKLWADKDGKLEVDYGNAWWADGQMDRLIDKLKNDPNDRRMIITGWKPERLDKLSLPCCHYAYQFHVANGKLNMVWIQRSVDMMIGLPSDFVLAAIWVITLANQVGLEPGEITMQLGDCHVYEEHLVSAKEYVRNVGFIMQPVSYMLNADKGVPMKSMTPKWFDFDYNSLAPMKFLLKE